MAETTRVFTSQTTWKGLLFECILHYDDADWRVTNDDGDPDDYRLIKYVVTNYHTRPLIVTMQRGNGQNWVSRTIPPDGQPYEQAAGGAVQYEFDLQAYTWEWGTG